MQTYSKGVLASSDIVNKEIYSFNDRNETIAMRPEELQVYHNH